MTTTNTPPAQPPPFVMKGRQVTVADPDGKLEWYQVLEQAFIELAGMPENRGLYGEPTGAGATLSQAWRTACLLQPRTVCLASDSELASDTEGIEPLIRLSPEEILSKAIEAFSTGERTRVGALYHDGRIGHAITLIGYDAATDNFSFHDPWPGRSLLCRENNAAGLDAQPVGKRLWRITRAELVSVLYAALVSPQVWAKMTGQAWALLSADLKRSDFWSFFRIHAVAGPHLDQYGTIHTPLKSGGFQEKMDLTLDENAAGRVVGATLALSRDFVESSATSLFAGDIAKSFIATVVSPMDRDAVLLFGLGVVALADPEELEAVRRQDPTEVVAAFLSVYLNMESQVTISLPLTTLASRNVTRENDARWLEIEVHL